MKLTSCFGSSVILWGGAFEKDDIQKENPVDHLGRRLGKNAQRLKVKLDESGVIHFLTLFLIRGDDDKAPSYLVLEMTADGSDKEAIEVLVEHAGDFLLPVYRLAAGIETRAHLRKHLQRRRLKIEARTPFFGLWPGKVSGLEWLATNELSVERVRLDQKVFDASLKVLRELRRERDSKLEGANLDEPSSLKKGALEKLVEVRARMPDYGGEELSEYIGGATGSLDFAKDDPKITSPAQVAVSIVWAPALMVFGVIFSALIVPDLVVSALQIFSELFPPEKAVLGLDGERISENKASLEPLNVAFDAMRFLVDAFVRSIVISVTVFSVLLGVMIYLLRDSEMKMDRDRAKTPNDSDADINLVKEIALRENRTSQQNHMISITTVIPSWLRRFVTLPLGLMAVAKAHQLDSARPGFLGGIGTIHSARFFVLPGTRKLVFVSNYNGSWESYLEDFIQKGAAGMTGIWSNCEGFPETEFLFGKGGEDGDRFKRFARRSMVPTQFWYSAYPDMTAAQIRRNALVTRGLAMTKQNDAKTNAEAWLDLFGSIQRPHAAIEFEDVQSIVFRGNRKRLYGVCQTISFPENAKLEDLQRWVGEITKSVSLGKVDRNIEAPAIYIAFSSRGLSRLGVPEAAALEEALPSSEHTGFPAPFRFGMDDRTRRNILGDVGGNAPEHWTWGQNARRPEYGKETPQNATDAVILIYAKNDTLLTKARHDIESIWRKHISRDTDVKQGPTIVFSPLPGEDANKEMLPITEPFGWVDGISQPKIRGVSWGRPKDDLNIVEAGEFILGYEDNRGYFPPTPTLFADRDQNGCLPHPPRSLPKEYPSFAPEPVRDFGRNGTFLVIRQLEQDVEGFEKWIADQAKKVNENIDNGFIEPVTEELLGAKLFGRWKSGVPLVRHAEKHHDEDCNGYNSEELKKVRRQNDFLYGEEDPQGHRCLLERTSAALILETALTSRTRTP